MYLGIDVGGTNLAAGLVTEDGKLLHRSSWPVDRTMPAEELPRAVARLCRFTAEESGTPLEEITDIGVGIPGQVDDRSGVVVQTPNLPFHNTPFRAIFLEELDKPVHLGNDANCAAVAEYVAGAAAGAESALMVTLGTGIGGGYVANNRLYTGITGSAFEVGHMVTHVGGRHCGCGKIGCWEQYGSASALIRMGREAMAEDAGSLMHSLCGRDPGKLGGRTVFEAAEKGDPAACRVLDRYLDELTAGLVNVINILQPEVICLGGGISSASDKLLYAPLTERVRRNMFDESYPVNIRRALLGNDAGIIGAAMLCRLD